MSREDRDIYAKLHGCPYLHSTDKTCSVMTTSECRCWTAAEKAERGWEVTRDGFSQGIDWS